MNDKLTAKKTITCPGRKSLNFSTAYVNCQVGMTGLGTSATIGE